MLIEFLFVLTFKFELTRYLLVSKKIVILSQNLISYIQKNKCNHILIELYLRAIKN